MSNKKTFTYVPVASQAHFFTTPLDGLQDHSKATVSSLLANPQKHKIERFVVLSDTHNEHDKTLSYIPNDGDVFLHCGDFTDHGTIVRSYSCRI